MRVNKPKKKMTNAEKAAARVLPAPKPAPAPPDPEKLRTDRRHRRIILVVGIIVFVLLSFTLWTCNYSHEGELAQQALVSTEEVAVDNQQDWIAFGDPDADSAFIFYPGARVTAEAYAPLMNDLANEGMFCVIVKAPFNLSVLKADAASAVMSAYSQQKNWYVGGHSLGGTTACQWAADNISQTRGVILLASYPTVDLTQSGLRMLEIYGSEDGVINRDNLSESVALQPADTTTQVIEGGNHAQFGDYGTQDRDGTAMISAQEQREQAEKLILDWVKDAA